MPNPPFHFAGDDDSFSWAKVDAFFGTGPYLEDVWLDLPDGFEVDRCLISLWALYWEDNFDQTPALYLSQIGDNLENARTIISEKPGRSQPICLSPRDRRLILPYAPAAAEVVLTAAYLAKPWIEGRTRYLSPSELRAASEERRRKAEPERKKKPRQRLRRRRRRGVVTKNPKV